MMFSLFQFDMGERIAVDPTWIVALQAVGGAAGNMICVHNVVAASAVVGLLGKEGAVIRMTVVPFVYYALLPGRGRLRHRFVRDQRIAECRNPAGAGDRCGGGNNDRAVPRPAGGRRLGGRSAA